MNMLTCVDCGNQFEFTESEQKFFQEKGFAAPKRCFPCRKKRKQEKNRKEYNRDENYFVR